ncbi:MAG TPA: hypothetical protein VIT64_08485 [Ilumatobacteraceae bacterium]|jgi:hypothetical protein
MMGMLIVFAAGYVLGSRGGDESFDEVVKALRAIRRSEEFDGLVKAAKVHAASSLRGLADMVEQLGDGDGGDVRVVPSDLLERVRLLGSRR